MASNPGDIVKAHCSNCKVDVDAIVAAAVADEIVTITCRTCGMPQRFRAADEDGGAAERSVGRRVVVDVEPRKNKKPRDRARRVGAPTPAPGGHEPAQSSQSSGVHSNSISGTSGVTRGADIEPPKIPSRAPTPPVFTSETAEHLFKRWDEATDKVDSRHARPHRSHESYEVGEFILDKVHGMGLVEEVNAEDGTLRVLFKKGYAPMPSVPKHLRPPAEPSAEDDDAEE